MVDNEYTRVVKQEGNLEARKMIFDVFEICDAEWRGLGLIPGSGLKIKEKFKKYDARRVHGNIIDKARRHPATSCGAGSGTEARSYCICGSVLQGLAEPKDCKLFGKSCKPENPVGACMVSIEGACNVQYRYELG